MFDGQGYPTAVLVDRTNVEQEVEALIAAMQSVDFVGIDCETHDDRRHEGLNILCGYDSVTRKKSPGKKLAFDMRRTDLCGVSFWPEGATKKWYFNFGHADTDNVLPIEVLKRIVTAKPEAAIWIAHNANFELTVFMNTHDIVLAPIICTMQMAVSTFGPDEYPIEKFLAKPLGALSQHVHSLLEATRDWDPDVKKKMPPNVEEIVGRIVAKEADSAGSYNGWIDEIAYGYNLKKLVKSLFNYDMVTYEEVLGAKAHMGQLTGAEVVSYGCDDAYWCVRVFRKLLEMIPADTLDTFMTQENPMVPIYSDIWRGGMKINKEAILARRDVERVNMANQVRELKAALRSLLPFPTAPNEKLHEKEKWYAKSWLKYRARLEAFATLPDAADDYEQLMQVSTSVGTAWTVEKGIKVKKSDKILNPTYYMNVRMMVYDLAGAKVIVQHGKVESDGETRGKIKTKAEQDDNQYLIRLIDCLNAMASIEQRIKLYITPYLLLVDPETDRLYPTVSSMQAARRMGIRTPNTSQLAKRGESVYIRGFYEGDTEDDLIVSLDWSAIELVIIGELSKDPEFIKCYGQLPHADLHAGAAADILSVEVEGLTEEIFKALRRAEKASSFGEMHGIETNRLFTNLKGEVLAPAKAYGYWRTEIGKGANFNYWYSGFLGTVGERMGWSEDQTGRATERYRQRFATAEEWRVQQINMVRTCAHVILPDHHRRTRYEATPVWATAFMHKWPRFDSKGYTRAIWEMAGKIARRAGNQAVNAEVQGTCSTIAKRSAIKICKEIKDGDWPARFLMPVHDELVFTVRRSAVADFIPMARDIMVTHPEIFQVMALDASPSVGVTYEPWNKDKAPLGQVELFEPPEEIVGAELAGKRLDRDGIQGVVDYLQKQRTSS
jgi:hypothetical protein